jgi:uncharacterized repeat protein (TIGR03803 family)
MLPAHAQTTYTETILHDFATVLAPYGAGPGGGLIRDQADNLYGTTHGGGTWGQGTVFKVDTAGNETVLYNFTGGADGSGPVGALIRDEAGSLFGTTEYGGNSCDSPSSSCGVVYKIDTAGHETVLYAFAGLDGENPSAGLIRDAAGNLYGTTVLGGKSDSGVVFKLDTAGRETVLHSFIETDGSLPNSGVVLDSGNLYGTTSCGGTGGGCGGSSGGVVYKLDAAGHETVLYNFTGGADGSAPIGGVVLDSSGSIYGTTEFGGSAPGTAGLGVVYKVGMAGQETVLYTFPGGAHGGHPVANLILDTAGNFYGTTIGGSGSAAVIFKLDPSGLQTVLHVFTGGADGGIPSAGVIRDPAGNLFGTTGGGGTAGQGVVYKLAPSGEETVLYSFPGKTDGVGPRAGVVLDSAGNLYGTTASGGNKGALGGTAYKVDAAGKYTLLYEFSGYENGSSPYAGLVLDSEGNLYGTTNSGGANVNGGAVYKLDPAGNETVLHSFTIEAADGSNPFAGVTLDSTGNLYGTAFQSGNEGCFEYSGCGVVYKLDPSGRETVLYTFTGGADGGNPVGGVILDSAGNIYGTTADGGTPSGFSGNGVVFTLTPAGQETVLYTFTGGTDGSTPDAGLVFDSEGNLYGTTYQGGASGYGVVFKLDPSGKYSVLYNFTGQADGGNPIAGVVLDAAGNLYGTTEYGGSAAGQHGHGVVYEVGPSGQETVLHTFAGPPDGSAPYGGVIFDSAGNLYGTTYHGGKQAAGVVFELTPQ